jgi:hypothetical protein
MNTSRKERKAGDVWGGATSNYAETKHRANLSPHSRWGFDPSIGPRNQLIACKIVKKKSMRRGTAFPC